MQHVSKGEQALKEIGLIDLHTYNLDDYSVFISNTSRCVEYIARSIRASYEGALFSIFKKIVKKQKK